MNNNIKRIIAGTGIALYGTVAFLLIFSEPATISGLWTNAVGIGMALVAALVLQEKETK